MPAYLSPIGNEPQIDTSGDPLVGGKIYTYLAGTSTAQDSYTSSTGLVAQDNPIILNSRGAPDNPIWLQGSLSYKFIVKDADDVTLMSIDNITGINDPSLTSVQDQWVLHTGEPTYISATSFSVPGDQTAVFTVGRRLKSSNTGGTIYSTISASSFGSDVTTVTVFSDSGSLDSGMSAVSYGLLTPTNHSIPFRTGTVLQVVTPATDGGSTTNATALNNVSTSLKTITPKSTNSILLLEASFDGRQAALAGQNPIATFQFMESSSGVGLEYTLNAPLAAGGVGAAAPCVARARLTNSALTARSFTLGAKISNSSSSASALNQVWTITEIQQ